MASKGKNSTSSFSITTFSFYVNVCAFFACHLLSKVHGEISSPAELTVTAGQNVIFQFNTTVKNAGIKAAKFGLDDGIQDDPVPKFITVVLTKNGAPPEVTFGEDLNGKAASYNGRVSFVGNLTKGQAWFHISRLKVTDTNYYMCKISEDSDVGYKQTKKVKLTVLDKDITPTPTSVSEAKYTDFKGLAEKNCKSNCLLNAGNSSSVKAALRKAYLQMPIDHTIKMIPISIRNKTATAWFHIIFKEAINRSYAFSFLEIAQGKKRLEGYNITCFEKLVVNPVPNNAKHLSPWLIATFAFIGLVSFILVLVVILWFIRKFKPELVEPFDRLFRDFRRRFRKLPAKQVQYFAEDNR